MIFLVTHNPKISYSELARITCKSIDTIKRLICKLKEDGLIKQSGSPRGGERVLIRD
ncbi:MAG TPA: winged helix-turn-helix transcriptional regulator [Candidatus Cloacimonas acidaminovorans]|nr:winged helix-turn-helix transcriptional regulator [Candidatus Cloacimonas acidaminovorans]HRS61145.1 winged helix-turn-helix transcriptional regulator [Candidatus Cloacimonas sp.]HOS08145.1 winged helix-turn-helix transcriptional regulator [Candidatus Cloacimonas acidaminovorans]HOT39107.1 winged helix-turn-helix transcriptional regulator [Candidatus Cloacimonas acidaminovorans]HPC51097.1 winged helix-turn-helix transcriptional regulator [Candidatus Cloacimonas acidaminovorans]